MPKRAPRLLRKSASRFGSLEKRLIKALSGSKVGVGSQCKLLCLQRSALQSPIGWPMARLLIDWG